MCNVYNFAAFFVDGGTGGGGAGSDDSGCGDEDEALLEQILANVKARFPLEHVNDWMLRSKGLEVERMEAQPERVKVFTRGCVCARVSPRCR